MNSLFFYLKAIIALVAIGIFYFVFFYAIFEMKLDWTKEKELILWYNEYQEGGPVQRKFIRLFKKPNLKL